MKPSEWIEKLEEKDMSKEPFLAMSEEEAKKLDERFIDREEIKKLLKLCFCKDKDGAKLYQIPNKSLERLKL